MSLAHTTAPLKWEGVLILKSLMGQEMHGAGFSVLRIPLCLRHKASRYQHTASSIENLWFICRFRSRILFFCRCRLWFPVTTSCSSAFSSACLQARFLSRYSLPQSSTSSALQIYSENSFRNRPLSVHFFNHFSSQQLLQVTAPSSSHQTAPKQRVITASQLFFYFYQILCYNNLHHF